MFRHLWWCLVFIAAPLLAQEPQESPEAIRQEVLKDCRVFVAFSEAKLEHIRLALSRGKKEEAVELAGRLKAEEARTLERVIWAMQPNRALRERVEFLRGRLDKIKEQSAEEFLKEKEHQHFKVPVCCLNPYAADAEGVAPPTKPGASPEPGASPHAASEHHAAPAGEHEASPSPHGEK